MRPPFDHIPPYMKRPVTPHFYHTERENGKRGLPPGPPNSPIWPYLMAIILALLLMQCS